MKQTMFCFDCKYFEINLGFECPKCGSKNIEIDKEVDNESDDDDRGVLSDD